MPAMFTLAKGTEFQGVFTQRKILWEIIEQLEGKKPTAKNDPIESLVIRDENGKIKSPEGNRYTTMTYAHLCALMRDNNKIRVNDAKTFETSYFIWQSEKNKLFSNEKINE
jgi:hypothetical protein